MSTCSGGQKRSFGYSSLGRLLNATNPESGMTSYTYYDDGSLWTRTDARPVQSAFTYDALNRPTGKTYSDYANPYPTPWVAYTYDDPAAPFSKGRLTRGSSNVTVDYLAYAALGPGDEEPAIDGGVQLPLRGQRSKDGSRARGDGGK